MFDKCLAESGILPKSIDDIVIIVGPGSYTGIRVGIAFVLGISLSLNTNIIPLSLFDVLDLEVDKRRFKKRVILVDSNKNHEWYFCKKNDFKESFDIGVASNSELELFSENDYSLFCYDASDVNSLAGVSIEMLGFDYQLIFDNIEVLNKVKQGLEPLYIKKNVYSLK